MIENQQNKKSHIDLNWVGARTSLLHKSRVLLSEHVSPWLTAVFMKRFASLVVGGGKGANGNLSTVYLLSQSNFEKRTT